MPDPIDDQLAPGLYDRVVTDGLRRRIKAAAARLHDETAELDNGDAHDVLSRYVSDVVRSALRASGRDAAGGVRAQVERCNRIIDVLLTDGFLDPGSHVEEPGSVLRSLTSRALGDRRPPDPPVPLSTSALLANQTGQLSIGEALRQEIASADRIDLICAFINFTGVRILRKELEDLGRRGGLRLITTTYMGATQRRALDALVSLGAEVRVAYEGRDARTKLHAKAWLIRRNSGYHTAFVGSSNLSHSALLDGLEWNVRLSAMETPHLIDAIGSLFERYWADPTFEPYDPARDSARLERALNIQRASDDQPLQFFADITPRPHQLQVLEALELERDRHGKWRNLVVAATGTGKTIIAALDFKRLRSRWKDPTLLFVAHRHEILRQSQAAFRAVLRDGSFGELWVAGERPTEYRQVFASVQTLANLDLAILDPAHFDVVIVDEFHHAEAPTYRRLLDHVRPRVLLGLTATPERTDGTNVMAMFGGECTVEMRLWNALADGLLAPFQYFGIADSVDLSGLRWERGAYAVEDLERLYVDEGKSRAALVMAEVQRIVADWRSMRALGFCASVRHAEYMARCFQQMGVASAAVSAGTPADERADAIKALRAGRLCIIFAVDLFNEGVDIPEVDTVLFLRPTESATVFLQQLGRGLRRHEDKSCLTVLDFIGAQHRKFRFDQRFRAMTGLGRMAIEDQIQRGFRSLPPGCSIQLDRVATERVLGNLRTALPLTRKEMVQELRRMATGGDVSLRDFLGETGLEPADLYRNKRYLTALRREAGLSVTPAGEYEQKLGSALERLLNVEDSDRLQGYTEMLREPTPPVYGAGGDRRRDRMLYMLVYTVVQGLFPNLTSASVPEAAQRLWAERELRNEIVQLLAEMERRAERMQRPLARPGLEDVPICTHGVYAQDEIMTAFGMPNPASMRQGVAWFPEHRTDVLLVTLRKTEADYSPTTRYEDYPISADRFHWESQSLTAAASRTGQRYINHDREGTNVLLFVREARKLEGRTSPYLCAGPAEYVQHESDRPMRIIWRLETPLPAADFLRFRAAAG